MSRRHATPALLLLAGLAGPSADLDAQGAPPPFLQAADEVPQAWSVRLFADVGARQQSPDPPGTGNSSFSFGSVSLLGAMDLAEDFPALAELAFEATGSDTVEADLERLWVAWARHDAFHLTLGIDHTALVRWNRLYHHGRWLETTIDRPYVARFADLGGVVAMHAVGLHASGILDAGPGELEYLAFLSNGRGATPGDRQRYRDGNDQKALEGFVAWRPHALPGLQVGVSGRADRIPADPTLPGRAAPISELAAGTFLLYEEGPIHVLGEALALDHDDDTTGAVFRHRFAYLQAGRRSGDWMPYARADFRGMDRGDPFYVLENGDLDAWEFLLGLRQDLEDNLAIKVEVGGGRAQDRDPGGTVRRRDFLRLALQVA